MYFEANPMNLAVLLQERALYHNQQSANELLEAVYNFKGIMMMGTCISVPAYRSACKCSFPQRWTQSAP